MKHIKDVIAAVLIVVGCYWVAYAQTSVLTLPQAQPLGFNDIFIVDQLIAPSQHRVAQVSLATLQSFIQASLTIPEPVSTTMTTASPTPLTFTSILAQSNSRLGCTIQNVGTTLGYVYFGATGSATTANSFQIGPSGGVISCNNPSAVVLNDNVAATCASGSCKFIIASQ